ncbi:AVAST type 2 anti-phage system protein Avs2 [Acetivibrio mesophilus]|uniref:ATP-binding protein n=1 Tax=Acetivibrio mesophilus TaxID=2487273 RepID=A0A4V1K1R7_9FIRM|nr:AVAST type 2 anti-phage system protein Avs2 [Acetivibrio mesophilus]RXE57729.1 ATP-binding protein [Acetivibrio mesophilus]
MSIDWNALRIWDGSQQTAFEELCCQLARHENIPNGLEFVRKGTPDAGVECYWKLENGDEWGWQSKFFTKTPEAAQWKELDKSITTVLKKHPKLKKYYICMPLDRADPRIEKQKWFMDKWNEKVALWTIQAQDNGMEVSFEYWGTSEIFDRLSKEEHRGRYLFWFNKEQFSLEWFKGRLQETIANVGPRYTPELNVKLPISKIFGALGCTDEFINEVKYYCGNCLKQFHKLSTTKVKTICSQNYNDLSTKTEKIIELKDNIDRVKTNVIDWITFTKTLEEIIELIDITNNDIQRLEIEEKKGEGGKTTSQRYDYEYHHLYQLRKRVYELSDFITDCKANLTNLRTLLLLGDAGSGKTHLLCDVAESRLLEGLPSILLLGGHFINEEPWSQVLKLLDVKSSKDEFLSILNTVGETRQCKVLLIIDALNEGEGRNFWQKYLAGFIESIKRYEWLCLAVSVRSTYETAIIPDHLDMTNLIRVYHNGFSDIEYEATNEFFDYYGIHKPSMPLLVPEFKNPLFLKLFCKSIKNRGSDTIPNGIEGLNSIFNFYIDSVNLKLSKEEYLNVNPKLNVIGKAIDKMADTMADTNLYYIPIESAMDIADSICHKEEFERSLYRYLISEGILSEDRVRIGDKDWIDVTRFSYERFTDFMVVKRLIEKLFKRESGEFDTTVLKEQYLKDEYAAWRQKGLVESLFVQLPEATGKELFELIPECSSYDSVVNAFIDSFIWRNPEYLNDKTTDYINKYIMCYKDSRNNFINSLLLISSNEKHPFNAEWLHGLLWDMDIAIRDSWWSILLHEQYGEKKAVNRLIDWGLSEADKSYISDKAIELISISLTWFLTSSNRFLRDNATKALVNILTDRISVVINLLKRFNEVNDPYVIERLYAIAYGCILRSNNPKEIVDLAKCTYELVFNNKEEVYPNVLLRDYARGIIEYALKQGSLDGIDETKIRPPYRSKLTLKMPSKKVFSKYTNTDEFKSQEDWTMYSLYESVMGFGDFARYVIGTNTNITNWSKIKISEPDPVTLKDKYDDFVKSLDNGELEAWEKYEKTRCELYINCYLGDIWDEEKKEKVSQKALEQNCILAEKDFFEILSPDKKMVYDKYVKKYLNDGETEKIEYISLEFIQAWIFRKVLNLGWSVEKFGRFDSYVERYGNNGRGANKPERIGKKYQWIALYEILARLSDNYKYVDEWDEDKRRYEGPWQLSYIRNIDPSCTLKKTYRDSRKNCWTMPIQYDSWQESESEESWLKDITDLPDEKMAIEVTHPEEKSNWFILENHINWEEEAPLDKERYEKPTRQLWYMIKSYIVKKEDSEKFYEWAMQQNFMGRWMPESRDITNLFLGEFYWSPAYDYLVRDENEIWVENHRKELPCKVMVTAINYLCEEGVYDCSLDESIRITLPTREIAEKMGVKWNGKDYKYYNNEGKVIFQDPSVDNEAPNSLLVRKEEFLKFLDDNGYDVIWTLLGEKNIIHSHNQNEIGWLEISGVYRYINGKIEGNRNIVFNDLDKNVYR